MNNQLDRTDTKRALAIHQTGGAYVVEHCSVWEGDNCIGTQITGYVPLRHADIPDVRKVGLQGLYDWVDDIPYALFEVDDVGWLQREDDAGRLLYPYGTR